MISQLGGTRVLVREPGDQVPLPSPGQLLGLDVETTPLTELAQWDPGFRVRTVQVATTDEVWVFDVATELGQITEILTQQGHDFCSHTPMDVLSLQLGLGIDVVDRNLDTRMLARMVNAHKTARNDLKELTSRLVGPELEELDARLHEHFLDLWLAGGGKKRPKFSDVETYGWTHVEIDNPVFLEYAALDAIACRRLVPLLIEASGAPQELLDTEIWLAREAVKIQLRGMRVDTETLTLWEEQSNRLVSEADGIVAELTDGLSPRSPKLEGWLRENGLVFPPDFPATPTGRAQLTLESIQVLTGIVGATQEPLAQVVNAMHQAKVWQDLQMKTRGVRDHLASDGRIHPTLHSIGAVTARMSSAGPNMQNFEIGKRAMFLPSPGHTLVSCDFDQVELRVVAALAQEQRMIDVILAGGDLHQLTVDLLAQLGVTITRPIGKMTNFLTVYGGGGKALHENSGRAVPLDVAYKVVNTWREAYPAIQALNAQLMRQTSAIRTVSGRRIPVDHYQGDPMTHKNLNYLVQSSSRDVLVGAWREFARRGYGDLVWYPVHDELVLDVPDDKIDEVTGVIQECMNFDFWGVPITATAQVLRDKNGVSRWGK